MNIGDTHPASAAATALDGWHLVGLAGALLFAGRWVVQVMAARRAGRPVITSPFWMMSLAGSLLLLCYFALGPHRDGVGVLMNVLPAAVASYNLLLALRVAK
jgi:lipid-A-disaccharide synthase-like uncharacterized protein